MSMLGRSGMVGIGSVAAPLGIFLILKLAIGLGPAASTAHPLGTVAPALGGKQGGSSAATLTPEQSRALAWLGTLKIDAEIPSPLEHPDPVAAPAPADAPRASDPLDDLKLSAVLSSSGGDLASINGKVYRTGDSVGHGFILHAIDTREQRIELTGPDGRSRWLSRGK